MAITPILGRPYIGTSTVTSFAFVGRDGALAYYAGGGTINGTKSRNPFNSDNLFLLTVGQLLGKVTSTGEYAPSILGVTTGALTGSGTSITVSAASAVEINRRIGATGTLTLTGPPTANGTARQATATYSDVNTSTGVITITALGTNQQEDVRFNIASTGGNLQLNVAKTDGTRVTTANIAWNATDATYLASINSALDTATGVVGGIVATAIAATDTDLGFTLTYSGTGYAGLSWPEAEVALLPTSSTLAFTVPRTTAVNGAFVAGSFVGDTDGTQTPNTPVPDGYGILVPSDSTNADFPMIPIGGVLDVAKIQNWPSDTGLKAFVRNSLSTVPGGKWAFSDQF